MAIESAQQPSPGKLIGKGLTSDIFSHGEGRIVKLFHSSRDIALVQREFHVSQAVHRAGIPAPAAFEITQVGNRMGIVFDHVCGDSMLRVVERRPYKLCGHFMPHDRVAEGCETLIPCPLCAL